LTEDKDLIG